MTSPVWLTAEQFLSEMMTGVTAGCEGGRREVSPYIRFQTYGSGTGAFHGLNLDVMWIDELEEGDE